MPECNDFFGDEFFSRDGKKKSPRIKNNKNKRQLFKNKGSR